MVSERKGWSRSRPLRVAFLVQEGEHANLALDGIIADCYNRWGGRFSLIVPCANGQITPIAHWLQAMKNDKRFIFAAAAHAQRAVDYLHTLQPTEA